MRSAAGGSVGGTSGWTFCKTARLACQLAEATREAEVAAWGGQSSKGIEALSDLGGGRVQSGGGGVRRRACRTRGSGRGSPAGRSRSSGKHGHWLGGGRGG